MQTLLEMVQGILSSQDGDTVSSWSDTEESVQVANCIRDTYDFLTTSDEFQETRNILELNASGDTDLPLIMYMEDETDHIEWIKYNVKSVADPEDDWDYLTMLSVQEFMDRSANALKDNDVVDTTISEMTLPSDFNSIKIHYNNDKAPEYFCMLNNTTLLFDSIDTGVDTTLQNSKVMAYGRVHYNFTFNDSFSFPGLTQNTRLIIYNEAKRQASVEERQIDNPIALQRARSLRSGGDKNRRRIGNYQYGVNDPYNNYGRKR